MLRTRVHDAAALQAACRVCLEASDVLSLHLIAHSEGGHAVAGATSDMPLFIKGHSAIEATKAIFRYSSGSPDPCSRCRPGPCSNGNAQRGSNNMPPIHILCCCRYLNDPDAAQAFIARNIDSVPLPIAALAAPDAAGGTDGSHQRGSNHPVPFDPLVKVGVCGSALARLWRVLPTIHVILPRRS